MKLIDPPDVQVGHRLWIGIFDAAPWGDVIFADTFEDERLEEPLYRVLTEHWVNGIREVCFHLRAKDEKFERSERCGPEV